MTVDLLFDRFNLQDEAWRQALSERLNESATRQCLANLHDFLMPRLGRLLPPAHHVFAALNLTPLAQVRVVILGQDPYPTAGDAHGLAFSVQRPGPLARSLRNVLTELQRDCGVSRTSGDLTSWAAQGVLLLNATLTLESGDLTQEVQHHRGRGWELVTSAVLDAVLARAQPTVVLLWGKDAVTTFGRRCVPPHVQVLRASHPSPLSVRRPLGTAPPFAGCGHFSQANDFLRARGADPIAW